VQYPEAGQAVGPCATNQPRAFTNQDGTYANPDRDDSSGFPAQGASGPYGTDANGCMIYAMTGTGTGTPVNMNANGGAGVSVLVNELGYGGNFGLQAVPTQTACDQRDLALGFQGNSTVGQTANIIGTGAQPINCAFALVDSTNAIASQNTVHAEVVGCNMVAHVGIVPLNGNCPMGSYQGYVVGETCPDGQGVSGWDPIYVGAFSVSYTGGKAFVPPVYTTVATGIGYIDNSTPNAPVFYRTGAGAVTAYVYEEQDSWTKLGKTCEAHFSVNAVNSITIN
jgi:hypothetical protein